VTQRAPNALLRPTEAGPVAILDPGGHTETAPLEPLWVHVLETLLHHPDADGAELAEAVRERLVPAGDIGNRFARAQAALDAGGVVWASHEGLRVIEGLIAHGEVIALTRASRDHGDLLGALLDVGEPAAVDASSCDAAVDALTTMGLLVPGLGQVDWGDLRRTTPIDEVFGVGRGTPVDRHYLRAFVREHVTAIAGDVVDIGGHPADRLSFALRDLQSFRVLDVAARPGVDVVGDVHDPDNLEPECADIVLLFNVLEHCREPHQVAANIHRWLRPGGRCLVMVPNAQRLHGSPDDLWRFSEAGLAQVFAGYASVETRAYGNLTTVLASHLGIAAEELTDAELALTQADHPVATCAVDTRQRR
jgi:SAM-dependent methyltransferase